MSSTDAIRAFLPWIIFLLMLGIGTSLRVQDFTALLHARRAALVALVAQFLLLPVAAFALAIAFSPPPELQIGMVLLAASPSATTSTFFTYLARGDTALSIALTAFNKLFSVITLPLLVGLASLIFGGESLSFSLPATKTIKQLALLVMLPTILGLLLRHYLPALAGCFSSFVKQAAILLLAGLVLWVIWLRHETLPGMILQIGPAMLLLCLMGMLTSHLIAASARFSQAQRTAIALETGTQSGGTAILIATGILDSAIMSIPALVYSLLMYPVAAMFAWWRYRAGSAVPQPPA